MRAPWDCMLSEIIKIQKRHRNESTNKGNVKPTMLTKKGREKEKENPPVGTQLYLMSIFLLVLCQSFKRTSMFESAYTTGICKHN